jgi:CRISPR-associated protein Csb2
MTHLCITVRWLDNRYHGLLNRQGPPEWPPSPFRLFQALVAGAARYGKLGAEVGRSLEWLQSLPAPLIVAPRSYHGQIVRRFVPNNDGDKEPDRQKRLTEKTSRPTILLGIPEIHYLWPIAGATAELLGVIEAAHCLTCLGWGIDMAYGSGRLLGVGGIGGLHGIRWFPKPNAIRDDGLLRVPIGGSMIDLLNAHKSALNRIEHGKPLRTVEKPRVFDRVFYASAEQPICRPYEVFALRTTNDDSYRYPHAKLIHIAGMIRSASIKAMKAFPPEGIANADEWVKSFVRGLKPEGADEHKQFSYVPLPSIGHRHADAMIRRVMITGPFGCEDELRHLASQLDGEQLQPEGGGQGPVLDRIRPDSVTRQYLVPSKVWASVTPVILPGHDDHKSEKTIKLIERALVQSGIEQGCRYTWGVLPNFNNCLAAHNLNRNSSTNGYFRPGHLTGLTAVQMRVTFEHPVAGPLTIGAGRHCGLGVFAAMNEQ